MKTIVVICIGLFWAGLAGSLIAQDVAPAWVAYAAEEEAQDAAVSVGTAGESVDLSDDALPSLHEVLDHVFEGDWFQRMDLGGYVATSYYQTGRDGAFPDGNITISQASIFLDFAVTDYVSVFFELQTERFPLFDSDVRVDELYTEFRQLCDCESGTVNAKVGRFDLPFGEEYLRQDSKDSYYVGYAVGMPYGVDEGVQLYGEVGGLGFASSFTQGAFDRDGTSGLPKAVTAKVYGNLADFLYTSASFYWNGESATTALCFTRNVFTPVGANGVLSSAGASSSRQVSSTFYSLDSSVEIGDRTVVDLAFGQGFINDARSAFDRDILWFHVQPRVKIVDQVYLVGRWSEAGTYSSRKGYAFEGAPYANGISSFGFDTSRFVRGSVGLYWKPLQEVTLKGEVGYDRFYVIDLSPRSPTHNKRAFGGLQLVVTF